MLSEDVGGRNVSLDSYRERITNFSNEFDLSAANKLPDDAVKYYVNELASNPDSLRGSFEFYRAFDATIAQNEQRKTRPLTMPVLAIGGEKSSGQGVGNTMRLVAEDVQGVVLPGSGHWVAEEAPNDLLAALTPFLAPYRAEAVEVGVALRSRP